MKRWAMSVSGLSACHFHLIRSLMVFSLCFGEAFGAKGFEDTSALKPQEVPVMEEVFQHTEDVEIQPQQKRKKASLRRPSSRAKRGLWVGTLAAGVVSVGALAYTLSLWKGKPGVDGDHRDSARQNVDDPDQGRFVTAARPLLIPRHSVANQMSPEEVAGVWGWFEADEEDYVKRYKEIETLENWVQANTEWGMSEDKWRIVKTAQLEITDKRAALESTVVPIGSPLRSILTAKDSSLYKPHTSLQVQDQQFYVSKVLLGGGAVRPMAILYTTNPEKLYVARLLYKSKSDGGWRMAPYVKQDGVLSKGLIHYTQETKLCHEIERLLELFERDKTTIKVTEDVSEFFKTPLIGGVNVLTAFQREVDSYKSSDPSIFTALQTIIRYQPGVVFVGQSNTDVVKWMIELPEEINLSLQNSMLQRFVPDFSKKAVHSYEFTHTLLGLTKVDVYEGVLDGQKVHWHMASDQEQRVWIERIYFPHIPISTYGVSTQFLNSGILTSKPLEYREQSGLLAKVTYRDGSTGQQEFQGSSTYVDITGFLDQLAPIQAYRAAKKILRGPGSVGLKILPSG